MKNDRPVIDAPIGQVDAIAQVLIDFSRANELMLAGFQASELALLILDRLQTIRSDSAQT